MLVLLKVTNATEIRAIIHIEFQDSVEMVEDFLYKSKGGELEIKVDFDQLLVYLG